MRKSKIYTILIAVVFFVSVILACLYLFSIKSVNIEYDVSSGFDTEKITEKLNGLNGDLLLFVSDDDVAKIMDEFPKLEVVKVDKSYPNVIEIKVRERRSLYSLHSGDSYLTVDDGGVVVGVESSRNPDLIGLDFDGVKIQSCTVGSKLITDNDSLLDGLYQMVLSVDLTDCVNCIKIFCEVEREDIIFSTKSGVDITIVKAGKRGLDKAQKAFDEYEACEVDYQKLHSSIEVFEKDDGEIVAEWIAQR